MILAPAFQAGEPMQPPNTDISFFVVESRQGQHSCSVWTENRGRNTIQDMKPSAKSSITLPPDVLRLVESLRKRLGARSKADIVHRGLQLLKEATDRQSLKRAYAESSQAIGKSTSRNAGSPSVCSRAISRKEHRSKDPDILGAEAALRRAAKKALQIGLETGTPVWVIEDGRMVDLTKVHGNRLRKK